MRVQVTSLKTLAKADMLVLVECICRHLIPYAITNRIVKALHSKDTSEKARLLESVVVMNYKEWRVFHELGKAYAELGNQEKARKYFLQALECKAGGKYKRETAAELEELEF